MAGTAPAADRPVESDDLLVRLERGESRPGLWVDPIYAARGYAEALPAVWLRASVAERLLAALLRLERSGLGLLVWDGWRPPRLQAELWREYRQRLSEEGLEGEALDRRTADFVTPPDRDGPPPAHLTGGAVDLTLCGSGGEPLDMGSDFDELSDRAHPNHYERPGLSAAEVAIRDRRRLLHDAMRAAGFWRLPTEWWHFEWGTAAWAEAAGSRVVYGMASAP